MPKGYVNFHRLGPGVLKQIVDEGDGAEDLLGQLGQLAFVQEACDRLRQAKPQPQPQP